MWHKLGLDWKLLAAQIINFAALVAILDTFMYRPIVGYLEDEEQKFKTLETRQKKLRSEKIQFKAREKEILNATRQKSQKIIREAEEAAAEIKTSAQQQAAQDHSRLTQRNQEILREEKKRQQQAIRQSLRRYQKETLQRLSKNLNKKTWPEFFWQRLLNDLEGLTRDELGELDSNQAVLVAAGQVSNTQKAQLQKILAEKLNSPVTLKTRRNPGLMQGYQLKVGSLRLQENLFYELDIPTFNDD